MTDHSDSSDSSDLSENRWSKNYIPKEDAETRVGEGRPEFDASQLIDGESGGASTEACSTQAEEPESTGEETKQDLEQDLEQEKIAEIESLEDSEEREEPQDSQDSEKQASDEAELSPLRKYILSMAASLIFLWLPFAINACLASNIVAESARLQAIINIFTAAAPVIALILVTACGDKSAKSWAIIGIVIYLLSSAVIGGLPLAFKCAATYQALMKDSDPNLVKLNEEAVQSGTRLVLYSYNQPLERTKRILRSEQRVFPGLILVKLQGAKND